MILLYIQGLMKINGEGAEMFSTLLLLSLCYRLRALLGMYVYTLMLVIGSSEEGLLGNVYFSNCAFELFRSYFSSHWAVHLCCN